MYNQSYEEYMRNILGYPANNNIYDMNENYYPNYNQDLFDDTMELEQYYPEVYNKVYPKVRECCLRNTNPINQTLIDNMVEEVYNSMDSNQEVNSNRNSSTTKVENRSPIVENRQRPNNYLRDLIRILLLRELIGRPGRPPRPRPPFRPPQRPFI